MGATLGWARFLLASTSEEGIESSDDDVEVVGTSGEAEAVDAIDEGVGASGEAEAMDVSVEGAEVSVAEGEEFVVVKNCHLEPNLMLVALQERHEASRLPAEVISEEAEALIKVQHSSVAAKKDDDPESLICRPNFGFVTRPQQHTPKKRHPKNKRAMGINLLDREGKISSHDKLLSQGCLVDEYNNLLLKVYQLLFDLKELMEICGESSKIQSEVFLQKAMKKARRNCDEAVVEIVIHALKEDDFIVKLLRYLKSQFNSCRTNARKIRNQILRIGGTPINDPLSKDAP